VLLCPNLAKLSRYSRCVHFISTGTAHKKKKSIPTSPYGIPRYAWLSPSFLSSFSSASFPLDLWDITPQRFLKLCLLSSTALYLFLPMIICSNFRLALSIRGSFGYQRRTKEEKLSRCHSYCTFVVCSPLLRPVPNVCVLCTSCICRQECSNKER
jgi:hypothetical protein